MAFVSPNKRRRTMPNEHYKDIHIDSDFSDTKNPGEFTMYLQNALHNVTTIKVHSMTMPQVTVPISNKELRFTMDEEKEPRATTGHPAIFSDPGPTDSTVFSITVDGNFNTDLHYRLIGEQMVDAIHSTLPAYGFVNETSLATQFWRATPNLTNPATTPDPVTGETQSAPLNQFDRYTPDDIGATVEYNFVPRILVRINKDSKTEIYSNFKLRLRPAAYNGEPDQNPATSLAETMGFTITDEKGNLLDDPGVRTYLRVARTSGANTVVTDQGELIGGQYYFYKLTSEQPANFQPNRYLFITTPNISIRSQQANPTIYASNVLAKVPLTNYGTVPTFTKDTFTEHYVDVNDIDTIFIRILDEEGNIPDFQGVGGLSLHLRVWYLGN